MKLLYVIVYASLIGMPLEDEKGVGPLSVGYTTPPDGSGVYDSRDRCEQALVEDFLKDDWKAERDKLNNQLVVYISNTFVSTSYSCAAIPAPD